MIQDWLQRPCSFIILNCRHHALLYSPPPWPAQVLPNPLLKSLQCLSTALDERPTSTMAPAASGSLFSFIPSHDPVLHHFSSSNMPMPPFSGLLHKVPSKAYLFLSLQLTPAKPSHIILLGMPSLTLQTRSPPSQSLD